MSRRPNKVWSYECDDRWNAPVRPSPAYLTDEQAARWQRIVAARMLYGGAHYQYFVEQRRTQHELQDVLVDGELRKLYVDYNLLKRISNSSADLLFGAEPLVSVDDDVQDARLREFAARTDLHALLYSMEIECSFAGEAVLEAVVMDGETYLVQHPAEQFHPVGRMRPDRQHDAYVRYAEAEVGGPEKPLTLILRTTYREGSIERALFEGEVADRHRVALSEWPEFKESGRTPPDVEPTGVVANTIIWVPNLIVGGRAVSDYDGLLSTQDLLNAKQSQLARVIGKHAAPKVVAPRAAADDKGDLRAKQEVLYEDQPGQWRYLTWDAQIEAAYKDRDFAVDTMCVLSETSPVLLGIDRGGVPDSARAMRLRAMSSTSKAARKATLRRPVLVWALRVVQMLDQTIRGNRYTLAALPSIEMRDGLPVDESERATTISTLRAANAMSLERSVEMQIPDPAAAAEEVARIRREAAAQTPSVLLGSPGDGLARAGAGDETRGDTQDAQDETQPAADASTGAA
jgi:hypothetical protein